MKSLLTGQAPTTDRANIVAGCLILTAVIAVLNATVLRTISLGMFYLLPLLLSAVLLPQWAVLGLALLCAFLAEHFGPQPWDTGAFSRVSMSLLAFPAAALFVHEFVRRRRLEAAASSKLKEEVEVREGAEQEARALIEGSPAAILTINSEGIIEMSNAAAARLLAFDSESECIAGQNIRDFFPLLDDLIKRKGAFLLVRTMVEGSGRRRNGEMFFAHIWVSSYKTAAGPKLTAVVADASEQLCDREEVGLRQLLMSSRIVAAAVSHEIRNLATAACLLHDNIGHAGPVPRENDFIALRTLLESMRKLASSETSASADQVLTGVDLNALLRELNIILKSSGSDSSVKIHWEVANALPRVRADRSGLLQVFLNLAQNSRRALHGMAGAYISVTAYQLGESVVVRFADNGPGVPAPDALFQPFRTGAASVGLGLYVSRALIRTYGGELQYVRRASESCFIIELPALASLEAAYG